MPKRSSKSKPLPDPNQLAAAIVSLASNGDQAKDPLAVELGRRGGLKGGKARAEKLSAKRRQQIARKAAKARWSKPREP